MKNIFLNLNSLIIITCIGILFIPFIGCGPSKQEIEERAKQGQVWSREKGGFVQTAGNPYETPTEQTTQPQISNEDIVYDDIEVRVIDSCEYILWQNAHSNSSGNIVHKANCRNPIHNQ